MKRLLLTTAMALTAVVSYGQGSINFSDSTSSWTVATPDYRLRWDASATQFNPLLTSGGLVASNYAGVNLTGLRVELLYGASTVNSLSGLTEVNGGYATFRGSTSANSGSWFGGTRTFNNPLGQTFNAGDTVALEIIVWDSNLAATGVAAIEQGNAYLGLMGHSSIFQFTIPSGAFAPTATLPIFTPFTIGANIPEPTSLALVGLGASALLIFRRDRKSVV